MEMIIPIQNNQINKILFRSDAKKTGPRNNIGIINHRCANKNLNDVTGMVLRMELISIQKRYRQTVQIIGDFQTVDGILPLYNC